MVTFLGKPGGTTFGGEAGQIGAVAERATAKLLRGVPANAVVLHDLNIPGSKANIDHAVVAGRTVWLLDSKAWAAGWYVTVGGRTWRRWRPWVDRAGARPADKLTLPMAHDRIAPLLPSGVRVRCVVVVHPATRSGVCRIGLYRPNGAKAWSPARLTSRVGRWDSGPADAETVAVLSRLVRG